MTARVGVVQGTDAGASYPFAVHADEADAFLDFYLAYPDRTCAYRRPFTLAEAVGFSGDTAGYSLSESASASESESRSGPRYLRVLDADGAVVFDTRGVPLTERAWGDRVVSQWAGGGKVARLVWRPGSPRLPSGDSVGLPLDNRTCRRVPDRVTSIEAAGYRLAPGRVRLVNGYNTTFAVAEPGPNPGGRRRTDVTLAAAAGSGRGAYPGCGEGEPGPGPVRRINAVEPGPDGLFAIETGSCHRTTLPGDLGGPSSDSLSASEARVFRPHWPDLTLEQALAALRLLNDCGPCRRCDEFARVFKGVRHVFDEWYSVGRRAEAVRDTYASNRDRWLTQRECRNGRPARLVLVPQANCRAGVTALFCNRSTCCLYPVELRFTFRRFQGDQEVTYAGGNAYDATFEGPTTEGRTKYAPQIQWPVVRFFYDSVDPQTSVSAAFRACGPCDDGQSAEVTLTVHADTPGTSSSESASGSGSLGDNYAGCDLPSATPPDAALAIWDGLGIRAGNVLASVTKTVPLDPAVNAFDCACS